jgi:lambda family phage portal protein
MRGFIAGSASWQEVADDPYDGMRRRVQNLLDWRPTSGTADDALLGNLGQLRDKSRDLDRKEGIARGAIENYVTNVVADGLRPQSRIDHKLLGISEEVARDFERRAEQIFLLHTAEDTIDFHAQSNLGKLEAQVLRAALLDGDCFIIRRYSDRKGTILPTTIQVIEGARVRTPVATFSPDKDIREGVEFDAGGRPIAYHVAKIGKDRYMGADTVRVPRFDANGERRALHIFQQRLPGQSRGEPILAPVIKKFKEISEYSHAEIAAAVVNAYFAMFMTTEMGGVFGDPKTSHLGRSMMAENQTEPERKLHKFGPASILEILPGEKIINAAPGRPNSNFDPFVQAVLKQIGMGLGLPYEVLTQHFQSSYSAARAAILEAWKAFKVMRAWIVSDLCQFIWEWVISDAIADDLLAAPGFEDPFKRRLYLRTQWNGTEMESIDPLKEAKANETDINSGIKSRRYIVESQGRDFDKHQREYEEEKAIFQEPAFPSPDSEELKKSS